MLRVSVCFNEAQGKKKRKRKEKGAKAFSNHYSNAKANGGVIKARGTLWHRLMRLQLALLLLAYVAWRGFIRPYSFRLIIISNSVYNSNANTRLHCY